MFYDFWSIHHILQLECCSLFSLANTPNILLHVSPNLIFHFDRLNVYFSNAPTHIFHFLGQQYGVTFDCLLLLLPWEFIATKDNKKKPKRMIWWRREVLTQLLMDSLMLHCVPLQHTRIQQRKRKWSPTRRKSKLLEIGVESLKY